MLAFTTTLKMDERQQDDYGAGNDVRDHRQDYLLMIAAMHVHLLPREHSRTMINRPQVWLPDVLPPECTERDGHQTSRRQLAACEVCVSSDGPRQRRSC